MIFQATLRFLEMPAQSAPQKILWYNILPFETLWVNFLCNVPTLHIKLTCRVSNGTHKTYKIKTIILCTCTHCQLLATDSSTNSSGSDNGNNEKVKKTHLISLRHLPLTVMNWVFNITIYVSPSLVLVFFLPQFFFSFFFLLPLPVTTYTQISKVCKMEGISAT